MVHHQPAVYIGVFATTGRLVQDNNQAFTGHFLNES